MSYVLPGLWHFSAAMAFAVTFGLLHGDSLYYLREPVFSFFLLLPSSAFFFVPDRWAKKGLMKFLHYPLPDWDVLLLGPASHRNWLTHSALLPLLLALGAWHWPQLTVFHPVILAAMGLCIGLGSHLFWDCVGSQRHKIVIVPYWVAMREATSRVYLLFGAVLSLLVALLFANWQNLGL